MGTRKKKAPRQPTPAATIQEDQEEDGEEVDGKWKKVLYLRQPFPDNYSGGEKQFLSELRKNVSAVHYTYWDAAFGATTLMCHLNAVVLYFVLFLNILGNTWPVEVLVVGFASIPMFCLVYMRILSEENTGFNSNHVATLVTLLLFGYAFTPVIRTLTTTISTDTIYAVSILSAVLSCVFHNYGVKAPIVSYPISMSSGLCSAIFLLSRLKSDWPAFFLLVVAFVLHAYGADFRNRLFVVFPLLGVSGWAAGAVASVALLVPFAKELAVIWALFHVFVVFVCPYILVSKQSAKCTIHGPWDEAVPLK